MGKDVNMNNTPNNPQDNKNEYRRSEQGQQRPPQNGQRPMQNGQRPMQNGQRPIQNGQRPIQNGQRPIQNGQRPIQNGQRPIQNGQRPMQNGQRPMQNGQRPPQNDNGSKIPLKLVIAIVAVVVVVAIVAGVVAIAFAAGGTAGFFFEDISSWVVGIFKGDDEAPVIEGTKGDVYTVEIGTKLQFRNMVTVTDNEDDNCELKWDDSTVDAKKVGTYEVKYTATDKSGNKSEYILTIRVVEPSFSNKELFDIVAKLAKERPEIGYTKEDAKKKGYSKEKIVRDIYDFVNDPDEDVASKANIWFGDEWSNCPAQVAQHGQPTREGWKTDWEEEAYLCLTSDRMKGDCYTYYAVSKAFFEYFEIDNVGIQRSVESELVEDGTHYWNIVNIGTVANPKWYYFDGTRYAGSFSAADDSCLLTESQLLSYSKTGYYCIEKEDAEFFDAGDNGGIFPKIETKKLS